MVNHFLPGLRCLRTDMEQLSPEHEVRRHADMRALSRTGGVGGFDVLTRTLKMHTCMQKSICVLTHWLARLSPSHLLLPRDRTQ